MRKFSGVAVFFLICLLTACGNDTSPTISSPTATVIVSTTTVPTTTLATTTSAATTGSTTTLGTVAAITTTVVATTASNVNVKPTAQSVLPTLSLIANNSMLKQTKQVGNLLIQLEIVPGSDNENEIDVTLFDTANNQPVTDASLVQVQSNSTEMDMGLQTLDLKPNGKAGMYESKDLHFTMFGNWKLDLLLKLPNQSDVTTSFEFNIVQ